MPSTKNHFLQLAELSPGYFSMVMATGIIAIGSHLLSLSWIAWTLFTISAIAYAALWVLFVLRAIRYPRPFFSDWTNHLRGMGFFTMVAGTGILASEFIVLRNNLQMGLFLFIIAAVLWVVSTYGIFTALTITKTKPPLDKGISGTWLLAIVATQSIVVTSALLAKHVNPLVWIDLNFVALSMWLWGGMLYLLMISLIFYRYTFFQLTPEEFTPSYWINMGAMAISTLGGALLIMNAPSEPYLNSMLPFIKGITIFYWASGTWWIPLLLILGFWRHSANHVAFRYEPAYWSAVFPLGMYGVGTHQLIKAMHLSFLHMLSNAFIVIAIIVWTILFITLILYLLQNIRQFRF